MNHSITQSFDDPVFETERLLMGKWHIDLADQALEIYGDPDVAKWIGGIAMNSLAEMRQKINELIERNNKWPDDWGSWPAFCNKTRQLVGAMLMKPLPDANGKFTPDIEIGWHLGKAHWGNGYATEGGRRMIEIAFGELNLKELSAVTGLDNVRSQSVARRLGMTHFGQTNQYYGQTVELFKISNPISL